MISIFFLLFFPLAYNKKNSTILNTVMLLVSVMCVVLLLRCTNIQNINVLYNMYFSLVIGLIKRIWKLQWKNCHSKLSIEWEWFSDSEFSFICFSRVKKKSQRGRTKVSKQKLNLQCFYTSNTIFCSQETFRIRKCLFLM